ncbi:hypothetical protein [Parapedobacter lycopersici]|uniref:hypothetical protein n=1 Tax=Parapedobacter lycopersici TaxID=1864939 RepID=UPI0033414F7E
MSTKTTKSKGTAAKTGTTVKTVVEPAATAETATNQEAGGAGADERGSTGLGNAPAAKDDSAEVQALKARIAELESEKAANASGAAKAPVKPSKIKVKHGVLINGKKYSKDQIEADPSIQEYLVEIKSGAVEAIK